MGTPIVNLDTLIDTRVSANLDVQTTLVAKQDVLDAVVDAQAVLDSVDTTVANKKIELTDYTTDKKVELEDYKEQVALELVELVEDGIVEYDANVLHRVEQYDTNHTEKMATYNANDSLKMEQYNDNHIERLENINFAYADRIVQMLNTKRILGMVDEFVAETDTHMCTFLSTNDSNYIYYANGTKLELGTDYTVYDTETIELTNKLDPFDVVTQINSSLFNDMLEEEHVVFMSMMGQPDGIAGLDENGLIFTSQLPSYVDDVIEVGTYAELPVVGEGGKIYIVVVDENNGDDTSSYRWTGTTYALISNTMTADDVKALYESNANTNEFTDTEKTKLSGIEDAATADQTAQEIEALYEGLADTNKYTDAEKTKLADTEITSQLNSRDTANRSRSNHTDTQSLDTVTETVDKKIMTADERTKLSGIEDNATGDQTAAEVVVTPQGNLSSTTVQLALQELQEQLDTLTVIEEW